MTETISESEKQRIFQFVDELELDYDIIDNGIAKPALEAADGMRFHFHKNGDEYVVAKYDKGKDREGTSGAYQFYQFKSLTQIMEQLKIYDEAIPGFTFIQPLSDLSHGGVAIRTFSIMFLPSAG